MKNNFLTFLQQILIIEVYKFTQYFLSVINVK